MVYKFSTAVNELIGCVEFKAFWFWIVIKHLNNMIGYPLILMLSLYQIRIHHP